MGGGVIRILQGDCRDVLRTLEPDSIDACVTDPPYSIGFMGKAWDRDTVAMQAGTWTEVLRVLKPGAHLVAFGGTRTYHRLVCAIEDAGFEIRDCLMWLFGSGFPKSKNLEGEWDGWGSGLKPAYEPIVLARKPCDGSMTDNVDRHGTGALNIDGCRVGTTKSVPASPRGAQDRIYGAYGAQDGSESGHDPNVGRWPANVAHDGSDEVRAAFPDAPGQQADVSFDAPSPRSRNAYKLTSRESEASRDRRYGDRGSTSFTGATGQRRFDEGSAARFFYCAKASREDREDGLAHIAKRPLLWSSGEQSPGTFQAEGTDRSARNNHPTVKPTDLMRWLCRLVTPPGGIVLDPFMGSGSTGRAAFAEDFSFVGIEQDAQWLPIAEARIRAISPLFAQVETA